MRWLQELLVPGAILVTLAVFWLAAHARVLEQQAERGASAVDPVLAWHVLHPDESPEQDTAQPEPMAIKSASDSR